MKTNPNAYSKKVHKYNGSWSFFGNLRKTRAFHSSLFLDGRVLIIGGGVNWGNRWQKTEIWDTKSSKVRFPISANKVPLFNFNDQSPSFKKSFLKFFTELNWPELRHDGFGHYAFLIPQC